MNKLVPVYRVVGYILLAFAGLLCLFDLVTLLAALANPSLLLAVFIFSGIIIYTVASFIFDRKGIQKGIVCKASLRDWIRVNAFVTIFFAVSSVVEVTDFLMHPALANDMAKQMIKTQPSFAAAGITQQDLIHYLDGVFYVMLAYCILLLFHLAITFVLLKQYRYLFSKKDGAGAA